MTVYRLKKGSEEFQIVDGPLAGRKFKRGKVYEDIPAGYENRFEKTQDRPRETATGEKE